MTAVITDSFGPPYMDFDTEEVTGLVVFGLLALALALRLAGVETLGGYDVLAAGETATGYLAAGNFSLGVLSTGIFSVGVFAAGIFSVGIFSIGIFSVGVFSFGIYAAGYYVVRRRVDATGE
ncbi:MAG: hypothetical protein V5A44_01420 [Haloarculaceae archaeon]